MRFTLSALLVLLSGCATIVAGADQVVTVSTSPPGASCHVDRGSEPIAFIASTPAVISVSKSSADLLVNCDKPGFEHASISGVSSFNGWMFGNVVFGGLIGVIADAATAATYEYPLMVQVDMVPKSFDASAPTASDLGRSDRHARVIPAVLTTRMMDLPYNSRAKQAFLLGACSAGDQTACIIAGR